jgi:hypothetical protein
MGTFKFVNFKPPAKIWHTLDYYFQVVDRFFETKQIWKLTNSGMKNSGCKYMLETRQIWESLNL